MLSLIVAIDPNNIIGADGAIPWDIPAERALFKRLTVGHPVIMGRKTFETCVKRPLPGRLNIVVSKTKTFPSTTPARSLAEAIELAYTKASHPVALSARVAALQSRLGRDPATAGRRSPLSLGRQSRLRRLAEREPSLAACENTSRTTGFEASEQEIFIIGGAEIFQQALPIANILYISHLNQEFAGDTTFPEFSKTDWKAIEQTEYDEFTFVKYKKLGKSL